MSQRTVQQLVAEGEFRKASDQLDSRSNLSVAERVLRASLEFYLGDPAAALNHAETLLTEALDPASRLQALVVNARALGRLGSVERGISLLQKAITQAALVNVSIEAELRAQLVHDVLSLIGVEPAVAELPRLRECALKSGNAHALAQFHIAQARIAALRGPLSTATVELERASRLLTEHPHADIGWFLQHVRTGIASMDGHVADALVYGRQCLESARRANAKSRIGYALGNLANILVTSGNFTEARQCLEECLCVLPASSRARFAVLHTGIHLALLTDDEALADRMFADGLSTIDVSGSEQTYYQLWFELHRLKWSARRGKFDEVISGARVALAPAARLADKELHDRLSLLIAEALAYRGDHKQASELLATACGTGHFATPPYLIELYRVAAVVGAPSNRTISIRFLCSALRLLTAAGLNGLRVEVDRTAATLGLDLNDGASETPEWTLTNLGLILTLGRHPWVLGHELFELLRRLGACESAGIVEVVDNRNSVLAHFGEVPHDVLDSSLKVYLGEARSAAYWLYACMTSASGRMLWTAIERIVDAAKALQDTTPIVHDLGKVGFGNTAKVDCGMIAAADKSHDLLRTTRKLAPSNITVLITGETGTGKELFARALHDASPRSAKPFIPFNCSAVSRDMLDAQLFGYRKGAFTGAADAFSGVIRAAAGGTLFLDEIGEVALDVQPKLLRFLESGEIHPLGEARPLTVDVRVVAATNANLEQMVDEGRFREDLFYRLNVVRLEVPPLRERREEIPPLVQHYLDKCSREAHKTGLRVADETMEYLILYKWPGNVRQLANEIRRMVALAESGAVLMPEHLSHDIAASRRTIPASERSIAPTEFVVRMDQPMSAAMEHLERSMIQYALTLSSGRVEDAATRLGLSRKGLYLKRQRLAMHDANTPEHSAVPA